MSKEKFWKALSEPTEKSCMNCKFQGKPMSGLRPKHYTSICSIIGQRSLWRNDKWLCYDETGIDPAFDEEFHYKQKWEWNGKR